MKYKQPFEKIISMLRVHCADCVVLTWDLKNSYLSKSCVLGSFSTKNILLKDKNRALFLVFVSFLQNLVEICQACWLSWLTVPTASTSVVLFRLKTTSSSPPFPLCVHLRATLSTCVSPFLVPPLPPGCSSSPSPLHCLSHCWGPSETSSPQTHPPRFPPSSPLSLHPPALFSACSKVGSQPRHISSPSRSALPSVECHFQSGLCQTWS